MSASNTGRWAFEESNPLARAWFEANSMDGVVPEDPWSLVKDGGRPDYRLPARPDWADPASETAAETETSVLNGAGASRTRDAVDLRILDGVRARTGRIIDSQRDIGGWPDLAPGAPWIDNDAAQLLCSRTHLFRGVRDNARKNRDSVLFKQVSGLIFV